MVRNSNSSNSGGINKWLGVWRVCVYSCLVMMMMMGHHNNNFPCTNAFSVPSSLSLSPLAQRMSTTGGCYKSVRWWLHSSSTADDATVVELDAKQIVKVFGRMAEKYIMLDASGGMCCYSGCKDCEYRLPGGGYVMADQTASRPKWIPCYDERVFENSGKQHVSQWSQQLFFLNNDDENENVEITQDQFVAAVEEKMDFVPPLTNKAPYLSASAAKKVDDQAAIRQLWNLLTATSSKNTLTKRQMKKQLKQLSNGEEGWTWNNFNAAMTEPQPQ